MPFRPHPPHPVSCPDQAIQAEIETLTDLATTSVDAIQPQPIQELQEIEPAVPPLGCDTNLPTAHPDPVAPAQTSDPDLFHVG